MTTHKTSTTIKPYSLKFKGYDITIQEGSKVSNNTACGPDAAYRFWVDFQAYAEKLTGFKDSFLAHDLTYYGINVPAEYCKPY